MSQSDRILRRLHFGPMCSLEPLDWQPRIARTAARIQDLRDRGEGIASAPCQMHERKTAPHVVYELETADQGSLIA